MGAKDPVLDSIATDKTMSTGGMTRVARETSELTPGTMVGEYQIEGELGEGGMGKVYSAVHPVIAKHAAIKVLHLELSVNQEAVDRFVEEARSVNRIGNQNIVDIFGFGRLPDGRCYFVMEWLRGESLRDRTSRAPLPLPDAMAALETITVALEAAHAVGIVHRDLKPDNVFLVDSPAGPQVKLLDFGIAKLLGQEGPVSERTRTGNVLGTPAYMSPEQARGQGVDHRTDIYALGALTFELLTGDLVFPAASAADMIAKHLYEPPRAPSTLNSRVPEELDALVLQMLSKEADQRPKLVDVRAVFKRCRMIAAAATPFPMPRLPSSSVPWTPPGGATTPNGRISDALIATASADAVPAARRSPRLPIAMGVVIVGIGAVIGFVALSSKDKPKGEAPPRSEAVSPAAPSAASPPPAGAASPSAASPTPPAGAASPSAASPPPPAGAASPGADPVAVGSGSATPTPAKAIKRTKSVKTKTPSTAPATGSNTPPPPDPDAPMR